MMDQRPHDAKLRVRCAPLIPCVPLACLVCLGAADKDGYSHDEVGVGFCGLDCVPGLVTCTVVTGNGSREIAWETP